MHFRVSKTDQSPFRTQDPQGKTKKALKAKAEKKSKANDPSLSFSESLLDPSLDRTPKPEDQFRSATINPADKNTPSLGDRFFGNTHPVLDPLRNSFQNIFDEEIDREKVSGIVQPFGHYYSIFGQELNQSFQAQTRTLSPYHNQVMQEFFEDPGKLSQNENRYAETVFLSDLRRAAGKGMGEFAKDTANSFEWTRETFQFFRGVREFLSFEIQTDPPPQTNRFSNPSQNSTDYQFDGETDLDGSSDGYLRMTTPEPQSNSRPYFFLYSHAAAESDPSFPYRQPPAEMRTKFYLLNSDPFNPQRILAPELKFRNIFGWRNSNLDIQYMPLDDHHIAGRWTLFEGALRYRPGRFPVWGSLNLQYDYYPSGIQGSDARGMRTSEPDSSGEEHFLFLHFESIF